MAGRWQFQERYRHDSFAINGAHTELIGLGLLGAHAMRLIKDRASARDRGEIQ
jgi:hypothetical protein